MNTRPQKPAVSTQEVDNRHIPISRQDHILLFSIGILFLVMTYILAALL